MLMKFNLQSIRNLLALVGTCMALTGQAGTSTGIMTVSADIEGACSVSVSPMSFGDVVPGIVKETEAVVLVVCTSGTTYTLDLGDGMNHTTTGGMGSNLYRRQMASGANRLPYMVFQEAARATEIAATSALAATDNLLTSTVGTGSAQTKTIFGRIVGNESTTKPSGIYVDTVVITIAF